MIVAIDGHAGAGKSTVARALAERLDFRYVDTGAMYRAMTWIALASGVSPDDGRALGRLASNADIDITAEGRVLATGRDITMQIRQPRIDQAVPSVSRHREVREAMRIRQRELAAGRNVVIEGRDIGRVVAPDAEVKIFLTASPDVRASRRLADRPQQTVGNLAEELIRRDKQDAAQLERDPDATVIDTTELTVGQVVGRIESLVRTTQPA